MANPRDIDGINPTLMKTMNTELENVQTLVQRHVTGFKDAFDRAGVDATPIKQLGEVAGFIGGQLPMLKRRQAMAEQMARENGTRPGSGMVGTEWQGNFASPEQARQRAREVADKYKDGEDLSPDAWADILSNCRDPDFAEELCRRLGPDKLLALANLYRSGGDEGIQQRFRALANLMATASHRGAFGDRPDEVRDRFLSGENYNKTLALMKAGTVPWGTDFLAALGKACATNPAQHREMMFLIARNTEALQRILADQGAMRSFMRQIVEADPELRKQLYAQFGAAIEQSRGNPELHGHIMRNMLAVLSEGEFKSLLSEQDHLAGFVWQQFKPYLASAEYLQYKKYVEQSTAKIPMAPPSGPALPDDIDLKHVTDLLGVLIKTPVQEDVRQSLRVMVESSRTGALLKQPTVDWPAVKASIDRDASMMALLLGALTSAGFDAAEDDKKSKEAVEFWIGLIPYGDAVKSLDNPIVEMIKSEAVKKIIGDEKTPISQKPTKLANEMKEVYLKNLRTLLEQSKVPPAEIEPRLLAARQSLDSFHKYADEAQEKDQDNKDK